MLFGKSCIGSSGEKCGLDLVRNISEVLMLVIGLRVIIYIIGFVVNNNVNNFFN